MKLEEIHELWKADSTVDPEDMDGASLAIPVLHAKYLQFLSQERLILRKLETELKQLRLLKTNYYLGNLSKEELEEQGWQQELRRILRTEVHDYLDADKQVADLTLRVALQKEKTDVLTSILQTINNRGYHIKNAVEWIKFKHGLS